MHDDAGNLFVAAGTFRDGSGNPVAEPAPLAVARTSPGENPEDPLGDAGAPDASMSDASGSRMPKERDPAENAMIGTSTP